mmetsp:Transcript_33190/g.80302  ORF Transcript_33190/g.80302 Transcript_33190/m.80302 type:complete len:81 (+) Transcript_33190:589-831(+)
MLFVCLLKYDGEDVHHSFRSRAFLLGRPNLEELSTCALEDTPTSPKLSLPFICLVQMRYFRSRQLRGIHNITMCFVLSSC